METAFKQANYEWQVVCDVQAVMQNLKEHFRAVGDSRNDLPDKPVVL